MGEVRSLTSMTLEELWELFPVVLVPHDPRWEEWACSEIGYLSEILSDFCQRISHVGSTAIPDIWAKPIIDILIEVSIGSDWRDICEVMEANGYMCMSSSMTRMSFNKGYTTEGFAERVFHIHVHGTGDNDEIYFCDYLRRNPETAREYEKLKRSLLPKFRHNRDGYTDAKSEFVRMVMKLAKGDVKQSVWRGL